jgi:cytochrome c oxidase subunit 2
MHAPKPSPRGWTHRITQAVRSVLPLAAIALLAGCAGEYPQSTIDPKTDFAEIIHSLYVSIFWWTMLILAVVWVGITYVVIRFRAKPGDPKPKQIRGHVGLEIAWTAGPALIVVAIAIPTIQAVFATQRPLAEDALVVEVTGHRFWWEFYYPEQGVRTANELWLPVDRPVSLKLRASDVIHSFWVPMLGGKRDTNLIVAVPEGKEPKFNWLYFTPQEEGYYLGQCAEFCGESHAFMAMRVHVVGESAFEAWAEDWKRSEGAGFPDEALLMGELASEGGEVAPASGVPVLTAATEDPLVAMGRDVFLNQATCGACHAIQGTAAQGIRGPNLTRFGTRTTLAAGIMENNAENLAAWIHDPWRFKPAAAMPGTNYEMQGTAGFWPATGLSDEQVRAVSAYLLSLK